MESRDTTRYSVGFDEDYSYKGEIKRARAFQVLLSEIAKYFEEKEHI